MNDYVDIVPVAVTDEQADPAHPEHQRWVKETLVRDEAQWLAKVPGGHNVTTDAIERKVTEDVRRHYAAEREGAYADQRPKPKQERSTNPAADAAAEIGAEFTKGPDSSVVKAPPSMPCGWCGTCRACARTRRVAELVKTYSDSDGKVFAVYPGLAGRLAMLFWLKRSKLGPFKELTTGRDRRRVFNRLVEDICDASDHLVGVKWWT